MPENQSLSSIIVEAMRMKGVSVEKLSAMTGISDRILNGLLEEKYENLPAAPYVRGYLLKIASALNLQGEAVWAEYLKDHESVRRSGKNDHLPRNRFETKGIKVRRFWLVIVAVLVGGYLLARFASFYQRPDFEISNLPKDRTIRESTFLIRGVIEPGAKLTLQSDNIYPDKNGNFEKMVALEPGTNIFTFKISKFFGKEFEVEEKLIYEPEAEKDTNQSQTQNDNF